MARVNKILASVALICDNGNDVTFTKTGGKIRNLKSGRITEFRRQGNVYVMDIWILNPNYVEDKPAVKPAGFSRQGPAR